MFGGNRNSNRRSRRNRSLRASSWRPAVESLEPRRLLTGTGEGLDFDWAFSLGDASSHTSGYEIAVDGSNNVFISGTFSGTVDFDPAGETPGDTLTASPLCPTCVDGRFLAKYSSDRQLQWAIDTRGNEGGIVADADGNLYLGSDMPGNTNLQPWVTKYSPNGDVLWSIDLGTSVYDSLRDIDIDEQGNAYVVGGFTTDTGDKFHIAKIDATEGSLLWTASPGQDFVNVAYGNGEIVALTPAIASGWEVWRFNADAGSEIWQREFNGDIVAQGTTIDAGGNVWTTGRFRGTVDFDTLNASPGDTLTSQDGPKVNCSTGWGTCGKPKASPTRDIFVLKLTADGDFSWVGAMGGQGGTDWPLTTTEESGYDITSGPDGIYVTGAFAEEADFDPGADSFMLGEPEIRKAFVLKLDHDGGFVTASELGYGEYDDLVFGQAIALGSNGSVYTTGRFNGSGDFDPTSGIQNLSSSGPMDAFVLKLTQPSNPVVLSIDDVSVSEGDSGSVVANFTVTRSGDTTATVSVDYATQDATATASADYTAISATTVTFNAGEITKTISVTVNGDTFDEGDEAFLVDLSNAVGATISDGQGVGTILDDDAPPTAPTKFFVVDDGSDQTFEYDATGKRSFANTWNLNSGNTSPLGATSSADGSRVWSIDGNDDVYVYDGDGAHLGTWTAKKSSQNGKKGKIDTGDGIAAGGNNIWIVDSGTSTVYFYTGAASALSGNVLPTSSFSLASANSSPKGITTDGSTIWIVDDSNDRVFIYDTSGTSYGDWPLDVANASPTGLTIDPSGISTGIWVVDNGTDKVYQYDRDSGTLAGSFALAAGNTNPQGIADPLPGASQPSQVEDSHTTLWYSEAYVPFVSTLSHSRIPLDQPRWNGQSDTVSADDVDVQSGLGLVADTAVTPASGRPGREQILEKLFADHEDLLVDDCLLELLTSELFR